MQAFVKRVAAVKFLLLLCFFVLNGCSGASGDSWRYDPGIPAQVTGVKAESGSNLVTLSWTGNPVATSYNIYYISKLSASGVTKTNGIKLNVTTTSQVITGLNNNITYFFIVTAVNRDGESIESAQVSAAPGPISTADLTASWYFHTLVTGPDARWERGTMTVTNGSATITAFEDSSGNTTPPSGFTISVNGSAEVSISGSTPWPYFHGSMASRKNMILASWSPSLTSRAITIFQKKKPDTDPDYSIEDISGTGSGQNPNNPYLQGNGPTRFAYHQLYSGSNTEWEYCNGKVGQHGKTWLEQYKDTQYWDYGTPSYKVDTGLDILTKATSFWIDADGLVSEYWNYTTVASPGGISSFNFLVPRTSHEVLFTGRMTADKTVVVGVGTRTDASGANPQYFLRIMQLCFIPTDQAMPIYSLTDLAGDYRFHKISSSATSPVWAYGTMSITSAGTTTFPSYTDSASGGPIVFTDAYTPFTLVYYPDPSAKAYSDFANFITQDPVSGGSGLLHYYLNGDAAQPYHTYYDFYSYPADINDPSTWRVKTVSPYYFNEHGSLSYSRDMFVLTRTDSSGNSLIIGLK